MVRKQQSAPLPHLQFAVLGVLRGGKRPGHEIRTELDVLGLKKGGPAFYRLMARLEEGGLVEGWYEQEVVEGQIFRTRVYRASPRGVRAWDESRAFHLAVIGRASGDESAAFA